MAIIETADVPYIIYIRSGTSNQIGAYDPH